MSKVKKKAPNYKIISLRRLAEQSDIQYMAIYNTLIGKYNGLSVHERTKICNVAFEEMKDFFEVMGFEIRFVRIPAKEEVG